MAKFKIITPSADSFTMPGAGYELEMEALQGLDAEIVEVSTKSEDDFISAARDADALYAKGMPITNRINRWAGAMPHHCTRYRRGRLG
jgi:D-3-phosphoglycerate dehydrogenase / 2-oxoglutarate reductase